MTPVRMATIIADAAMLFVCIHLMMHNRTGAKKESLHVPGQLLWIMIVITLLISGPLIFLGESLKTYGMIWFAALWLLGFTLSFMGANQRLSWDENGFSYRTVFRQNHRYSFGDIRWIKLITNARFTQYRIFLPDRHIDYDSMTENWSSFLEAYGLWREAQNMEPWQNVSEREWLAAYRTHGQFRQKLDRVEGFVPVLILYGILGIMFVFALVVMCTTGQDMLVILISAALTLFFISPYIAVSELDRHRKWISWWYKGPIHPKPDER